DAGAVAGRRPARRGAADDPGVPTVRLSGPAARLPVHPIVLGLRLRGNRQVRYHQRRHARGLARPALQPVRARGIRSRPL
ncbi:MAG: Membrane protein insertion efficiency factor YidD, partial [uncultured Thermomicrobiales bacterium]